MNPAKALILKRKLEETHESFLTENRIQNDAIAPALSYMNPRDREFAGFICAVLAYGKVAHIQKSTKKILSLMGDGPVEWLLKADEKALKQLTKNWVHRFNTSGDMLLLLSLLKQVYESYSGLESFLEVSEQDEPFVLLTRLHKKLRQLSPAPLKRFPAKGSSFWFLISDPSTGSACKRLQLFLRWMAGRSEMDLGVWNKFSRRNLLIPVDTHVLKQARSLKLTARKTADWKTAVEITNKLRLLDPEDPTRFDFALCHLGIKGEILK